MIRNDGAKYINFNDDIGLCYWAFDNWNDESKRALIEETLKDFDEERYLEYLKKRQG